MKKQEGFKPVINKKARYDYEVLETIEAGIVLSGAEVKSLRLGQASLRDSYVVIREGQVEVINMTISPYKFARNENYDSQRTRKLLMRRKEIEKLRGKVELKGISLVPLKIYLKGRVFKLEVGIVRGKKQYEKREIIKKRDMRREMERELRNK